jgi:hypothetical protein
MPVRGLIHYALEVPDPVVGETFYRDFGLREARSATPGSNSIQLETGRTAGELILLRGSPQAPAPPGAGCAWR